MKYFNRMVFLVAVFFVMLPVLLVVMTVTAYAQDGAEALAVNNKILSFLLSMVPAMWAIVGPTAVIAVTGVFNTVIKKYIPREVQIPLAGLFSAIAATLSGGDPVTAAAGGTMIQGALSMNGNTFLAGARPDGRTKANT